MCLCCRHGLSPRRSFGQSNQFILDLRPNRRGSNPRKRRSGRRRLAGRLDPATVSYNRTSWAPARFRAVRLKGTSISRNIEEECDLP